MTPSAALYRTQGTRGPATRPGPRARSLRLVAALTLLLVVPVPGCRAPEMIRNAAGLVSDAAPPALGAVTGAALGGPPGAAAGAAVGVAVDAAMDWVGWERAKQEAAERKIEYVNVFVPEPIGSVVMDWLWTIVGVLIFVFVLGWFLMGPRDMLAAWKRWRRRGRNLLDGDPSTRWDDDDSDGVPRGDSVPRGDGF